MSEPEVRYLGDVQRLCLKEGDVLVLSVPGPISDKVAERLKTLLSESLPGHKVLIFDDNMKIGVMGQD